MACPRYPLGQVDALDGVRREEDPLPGSSPHGCSCQSASPSALPFPNTSHLTMSKRVKNPSPSSSRSQAADPDQLRAATNELAEARRALIGAETVELGSAVDDLLRSLSMVQASFVSAFWGRWAHDECTVADDREADGHIVARRSDTALARRLVEPHQVRWTML